MPEASTLSKLEHSTLFKLEDSTLLKLEDYWVEQWQRADEICRMLEEVVPRRKERARLYVVPTADDPDAPSR